MTLTLRTTAMTLLLTLALAFTTGCGSKSKKGGADDALNASDITFELDGDSDSGKAGGLQTIFFDYDSSLITSEAEAVLAVNADVLKANSNVTVQVEGHCDERGGVQYNLALGEKRAKAVKEYLESLGVESSRISTLSYGKERPLAFGHDDDAWSKNRRGNFAVTAK